MSGTVWAMQGGRYLQDPLGCVGRTLCPGPSGLGREDVMSRTSLDV